MSTYNYPFPTKNTGDAWSAAEHRLYIKNNFDFLNISQTINLIPDEGITPITGTAPSGPASVGGGASAIGYRYLGFSASAANWKHWNFPISAMWNSNAENPRLQVFGTMDTTNTGTKNIYINVYVKSYTPSISFNQGFGTAYTGTQVVENTAGDLMVFEVSLSSVSWPSGNLGYIIIGFERNGAHGSDDANGIFRFINARLRFLMDG